MNSITDLIEEFEQKFGDHMVAKRNYLQSIPKKQLLINLRNFGMAKDANGKKIRFSHFMRNRWLNKIQTDQNGNKTQLRDEFNIRLESSKLFDSSITFTFEEIFKEVSAIYDDIQKIGIKGAKQMTLYDIACFIGYHLNVHPTKVYIHQGVIKGAKALGLVQNNQETALSIDKIIEKVPELELLKNNPDQIESFLCLKKDELAMIASNLH